METSKYCRGKGIHLQELKRWVKQCQNTNNTKLDDPKKLQKELKYNEKDLTENAALLILRKKAMRFGRTNKED